MANNPYVNKVQLANGSTVMDISDTTAAASDVLPNKYLYLKTGQKVQGSMQTKSASTYYPSTTDQTVAASQYLSGAQTIKAVTISGLSADKILSGTTVKIGDSSDDDRITSVSGSVVIQHYYTGSSTPSSSLGTNGDIYLKTS